jgi:hypothetical protein
MAADLETTVRQIREEAQSAHAGHPLPLATHWCSGSHARSHGFGPHRWMKLIGEGHRVLPWLSHPTRAQSLDEEATQQLRERYEEPVRWAARHRLPLCFIASQWESGLSGKPWIDRPADENPNLLTTESKIQGKVSPFGPVGPWREIGRQWTSNPAMQMLQEWYPDPAPIMFLSNNEHRKLRWLNVEKSRRYVQEYGKGRDANFRRKVVGDGWIERYRALQEAMREGLIDEDWKKAAFFVGYGVTDLSFFGRWGGWPHYSLHTTERICPGPLMWDGGSPSYYTHDWNPSTDYKVWSPQIQFMNMVFIKRRVLEMDPEFWFEISVWDGYDGPHREQKYPSPRTLYRQRGQEYNPTRYRGFVQFGMWLMRSRAVREYRGWTTPWEATGNWEAAGPYFLAIVKAVDAVYDNSVLAEFWRHGRLVPNPEHEHPYQAAVPKPYQDGKRWFLLDCTRNPGEFPWEIFWQVRVFALALEQGEKPRRRWLVYAHSPTGEEKGAEVTLPGYGEVTVDSTVGGAFYLVEEKSREVTRIE